MTTISRVGNRSDSADADNPAPATLADYDNIGTALMLFYRENKESGMAMTEDHWWPVWWTQSPDKRGTMGYGDTWSVVE
ncbi:hypothetical protein B4923_19565 [Brenneria roseae subsp. americana]|uniref:Uncharacterized protein n=1 Tax=Brenneria roseae subsp. americana TaxID=1508507 RepID=A0A2U1TJA0_9GAMM|nr:hypothetical protein B4923_19565 [Brenneria roseae subsp. americana]